MASSMHTARTSVLAPANAFGKGVLPRPAVGPAPLARKSVKTLAAAGKGPSEMALGLFGALTAAQLALLPIAGPADAFGIKQILPKSATSESAREALNKKTDDLPSLKQVGKSLNSKIGVNNAKDIGKAIEKNTPDAPDLTKNPKDLRKDAQKAVKGGLNKLGDLSALPSPQEAADKLKGKADELGRKAGSIGNDAQSQLGKVPNPSELGNKLSGKANEAGRKAQNQAKQIGDLSALPSPQEAADKLKGKAQEVGRKAGSLGNDAQSQLGKVPNPSEAGNKLAGKANEAGRKVGNRVSELSALPSPQEAADKLKGKADELGRKAGGIGNDAQSQLGKVPNPSELGNKLSGKANEVGRKAQNQAKQIGDLSELPTVPGETSQNQDVFKQVGDALGLSKLSTPFSGSDLPSPQDAGRELGNQLGKATPDVPDLPSAGDVVDKVKDKASDLPNPVSDVSALPSPQEAADKLKGKANELGRKAGGVGNDAQSQLGKVPNPSELSNKLSGKANEVGRKAQNQAKQIGDLSALPSPQEAADKAKGKAQEAGRKAGSLGGDIKLPSLPNPSEAGNKLAGQGKEAARKLGMTDLAK